MPIPGQKVKVVWCRNMELFGVGEWFGVVVGYRFGVCYILPNDQSIRDRIHTGMLDTRSQPYTLRLGDPSNYIVYEAIGLFGEPYLGD